MNALVIGATGIVGGYIVEHLVREGQRPFAFSRSIQNGSSSNWVRGDLTAPERVAWPTVETVFCTAEIGLLAEALPFLPLVSLKRIVAFTSTSIVTKIESEIPAERKLLLRLADGEKQLIASCEQYGINWTILRPTLVYSEGRDGNISRMARLIARLGFMPLMGQGMGLRQPVHAEDLAIGAIKAAASTQATNKTYTLTGGETLTYREMTGRVFDGLGCRRRIVSVPSSVWEVAFMIAKPFFPTANVAMGRRMAKDMVFDPSAAEADFGWSARAFHPQFK